MRILPLLVAVTLLGCQAASPEADARRAFDGLFPPGASAAPTAGPASVAALPRVELGGRSVPVDVADTPELRRQGLSGRPSLAEGTGLVLLWDVPTRTSIWMPNMNFPIDVIFVKDEAVLAVYQNAQPCLPDAPCPTFGPSVPVDWVLEVPAGSAAAWGVSPGSPIRLVR